jgi:Domain of unknown function (DUF4386)
MYSNRKTAIIVGVLFIIGDIEGALSYVVTGGLLDGPDALTKIAASQNQVVLGALLVLTMGFALAMVPVLMYPIFRKYNEVLALGCVVFRGALETVGYMASAGTWLLLVELSREHAGAASGRRSALPDPQRAPRGFDGREPRHHRLQPRLPDVLLPLLPVETHPAMAVGLGSCRSRLVPGYTVAGHVRPRFRDLAGPPGGGGDRSGGMADRQGAELTGAAGDACLTRRLSSLAQATRKTGALALAAQRPDVDMR